MGNEGRDIKIVWGGKIEKDGRRHGQYQAERRNITTEQIIATILTPDQIICQSADCHRYFKTFATKTVVVVAVEIASNTYEVITCYWRI